jgi:YVTN family beta-propeller protein
VSYVLKSQGVTDRPSKNTSVSVEGKISPLRPPSVDEAPGDTLNPIAAKDSLTVVVPQGDLLPSDLLSVTWTGAAGTPAGGSHTTTAAPISTIGREIPIPNSVVAFNLGKAVTVTYTVTRNGTAYPPSQPLNLTVQAIPNEDGALPTPAIDGAVGNELNISTLLDGARTRIAKWPFIALGQKLWLRYSGTNADGTAFTDQTYNAAPIPTDGLPNGMLPHAPVAKLRNLKDGSTLRVEFKVAFDGSTDESTAVTFPVRPYTIKAVAIVAPTLDSVKGSPSGEDIPDNGYTVETAVTLSGTATKGLEVEVFDGATSRGKATANATTGIWTLSVSGLSQTAHRFTAKALYGSGEVSSARAINVTALIAPTLAKVADASGQEIPEAATTTSTTLTLSGKASNGQRVEIYEGNGAGAVSHGIATANATTGEWQHQVTLAQGGRRLYAQSRYHSSTVYTNVRTLTIVPVEAPTLTSVKGSPSGEDIPEGSTTVETAVTLSGTASKGQNVEVFDGTTSKGQATADKATGVWSLLVSGLSESVHRFKAKALYGTGVESAVRTFTVEADADAPIFTNGPYAIQPGGTFKNIILSLQTGSGTPIPNADITLVLPAGFIYADGGSGSRVFRTGTNGLATISGVKGPSAPGGHNMTATYRSKTATARLAIVGVIRTISGFQTPTGLAITPNGTRVYATNLGNHTVSVINTANFAIVDTFAVGKLPKQIASSPDGTYIFVNNPGSSTVSVINTANPTVIKSITGTTPEDGIAFSPDSSLALVSNANGHTVSIIDVANLLLIDTIAVGQTPRGVAFSPDGGLAFICNSDNTVSVMKTSNRTIIETINVGEKPWAIACSPDGTQAFVSNSSSHTVSVIDIATLTVIENISVRLSPAGIAWSPDGSRAFVCNVNAATVSVIDATSLLVTMTITGVHNPRSVVISPDGSRIYVGDQPANTVTVISV